MWSQKLIAADIITRTTLLGMNSNHYCHHDHDGQVVCEGVEEEVGVQGRRNSFDSQVEAVQALVVEAVVELVVAAAVAMVAAAAAENLGEDMEVESLNFTKYDDKKLHMQPYFL
jgi:hypothetical protein